MKKSRLFLPLIGLFIWACQSPKEKTLKRIDHLRTELMSDTISAQPDPRKVLELVDAYKDYMVDYPDDSMVAAFLFETGNLYRSIRLFDKAIEAWNTIGTKYPNSVQAPPSLFLKAFVYENDLGQLGEAKKNYEIFLAKYPVHEMADDAEFLMNNIGKSPEELLKVIEARRSKGDTAAVQ